MEIKARTKGEIVILDFFGRIDVDSANLVEAVGQCLRDGYKDIICNFEDVDFIDYLGVSAIALAFKEVINNKGRMKFVNIPAHLKNIFSITGIDRVIDIYATEDLAINVLKEDKIIENIKKLQLRRRFKRLPIDIKTEVRSKDKSQAACFQVDILNLSAIGAYLYGCDKFRLQDEIIMKFKLPPKMEELKVDAVVVWLSDKQIQMPMHPGMGVEFKNLTAGDQDKIIGFIERNLSRMSLEE